MQDMAVINAGITERLPLFSAYDVTMNPLLAILTLVPAFRVVTEFAIISSALMQRWKLEIRQGGIVLHVRH
jgi:hypothetical protein